MNHNKSYRKLGRRADHRKAMLKNMTISLVKAERIETTVTRAKELRKFAERMITFGKKNTLAARRNGGYTRIIKTSVRKGDSAEMAIIELV